MANFLTKIWNKVVGATYSVVYVQSPTQKQVILEFDSILEASISSSSEIVEYPIETGTKVTDYKYDNPDIVVLKGVISKGSVTNKLVSLTGLVDNQDNLIKKTEENLHKFKKGIYRLDIQTKFRLYENYTLQNFNRVENVDNFSLYEVEMTFKQIMLSNELKSQNIKKPSLSDTIKSGISKLKSYV